MRELSLFTGIGGGLLGTMLLGWRPVGYVEWDAYCQRVLQQRIKDGYIPNAPIFGDVREFNRTYAGAYRGLVDVVTGGFPCQPFSVAGKQLGADDPRNMWPATIEAIRLVRPRYAFLENVPGLLSSGYFGTILGDLAASGYDCRWRILSAAEVGAPHVRERLFVMADANGEDVNRCGVLEGTKYQEATQKSAGWLSTGGQRRLVDGSGVRRTRWVPNGEICGVVDGDAAGVDELRAIGNGQVPAVVATAWRLLMGLP